MANEVRIVVKAQDQASKTFKQVDTNAKGLNRSFAGLNTSTLALGVGLAGAGIAAAGASRAIWDMTNLASNLVESQNKVNEVFGSSASIIEDFAATASDNLRQTEQQALEAAGTFGNMFVAFGTGEAVAADMSKSLVQLSADLASFNNIAASDAADKLRAGLAGSSEVLLPLGVDIRATTVEAHALARGFADNKSELTELDRVMARFELILKDTDKAQGDAARTSDEFAAKTAELSAKFEELKTSIGENLIGPLTAATDAGIELIGVLETIGSSRVFDGSVGGLDVIPKAFDNLTHSGLFNLMRQSVGIDPRRDPDTFTRFTSGQAFGGAPFPEAGPGVLMDTRSELTKFVDEMLEYQTTAEGAADRTERIATTLEILQERSREAAERFSGRGGLASALDEIADAAEEAAKAAEEAAEAERKLNETRNRGVLDAQQQLIRSFMSNPAAGQNLIPLINNPFGGGLPDVTRGPLTPLEAQLMGGLTVNVQVGDQAVTDVVATAQRTLAATGQ